MRIEARPVLGISACTRSFGEETAQVVIDRYLASAMRHADVSTLLIPAQPSLMSAGDVCDRLDGLLLSGSPSNVEPRRYGGGETEGPFDPARDEMTMALVEAMVERSKPIFGICRGLQEINVAFGGTLQKDLGEEGRPLSHHAPVGAPLNEMFSHVHEVKLAKGGILARTMGCDRLSVNSVHYQGVDRLAAGLSLEASAPDNVIEAFSGRPNGAQVLAVQWHPEWQSDSNAASISFFGLLGRALRGYDLHSDQEISQ